MTSEPMMLRTLVALLTVGASGCTVVFSLDDYGPSRYRETVLADGPVRYLRLGETSGAARDDVTHADAIYGPGVMRGAAGALEGDPDPAVTFNGQLDSAVSMPMGVDFAGTDPFSVEVWAWQVPFTQAEKNAVNFGWGIDHQDYQVPRHGWGILFGTQRVALERWGNNRYAGPPVSSLGGLTPETWHHVVATFDGDRLALYIDGMAVNQVTGGTAIESTGSSWTVGRQSCGCDTDNFKGSLDEVAIYDKALDASRVLAHYTAAGY